MAGTFDNKVVQLDVRENGEKMTYYKSHAKPVLKVKVTPTHILSVSEDSVLTVHDRRAGKRLKKVELPPPPLAYGIPPGKSFPLSMDLLDNMLYVGDRCELHHTCLINAGIWIPIHSGSKRSFLNIILLDILLFTNQFKKLSEVFSFSSGFLHLLDTTHNAYNIIHSYNTGANHFFLCILIS